GGSREGRCAGRQRPQSVARVHDSHTEEQSDVGRVAGPEQGNRLRPPGALAALRRHVAPDKGHGHPQGQSPGQSSHEREHPASASREQGLANTIQVMKKDLFAVLASLALAHDLFLKLDTYFLEPRTRVRVTVLNGTFAKSEGFVAPDRVADISVV